MAAKPKFASTFDVSVPRKTLFDAVNTVARAVSGRSTLPILSHIQFRTEPAGLRLIANDLELSISTLIPQPGLAKGGLTSPAKTLAEVLNNFPDKAEVTLAVNTEFTVQLACEKSRVKILGLNPADYPAPSPLPEDACEFKVAQSVLRQMIKQTAYAAAVHDARPSLIGVLMSVEGDTLQMVATDTHRLAVRTQQIKESPASNAAAVVPARAMFELLRLTGESEGDVVVRITPAHIQFVLPGEAEVTLQSNLIAHKYVNWQRVVPKDSDRHVIVAAGPLQRAVRRAAIVARENAERFIFKAEGETVYITAESSLVGDAHDTLEVETQGGPIEIAFNARFFLDMMAVVDTEYLKMEFSTGTRPGIVRPMHSEPNGESDFYTVLMPMQII